jgi:hypothetical protein
MGFKCDSPREKHNKYSMVFRAATVLKKEILEKSIRDAIKELNIYNAHLFINNLNINDILNSAKKILDEEEDGEDNEFFIKILKFKKYKKKYTINLSFNAYSYNEAENIFEDFLNHLVSKHIFLDVLMSRVKAKELPETSPIGFRIGESCDTLKFNDKLYSYKESLPFRFVDDELYIGNYGEMHDTCDSPSTIPPIIKLYDGRIFEDIEIISFWRYPDLDTFKRIINKLEKKLKIKIWNDNWLLEIKDDEENRNMYDYVQSYKAETYNSQKHEEGEEAYAFIKIEDYKISKDIPEDVRLRHLNHLHNNPVPDGYGSKNPNAKPYWYRSLLYGESFIKTFENFMR